MGGISPTQLIIILAIVLLVFGTKKLKNLGSDLGGAIKGFKSAMDEDDAEKEKNAQEKIEDNEGDTFDVQAKTVNESETEKAD